MKFKIKRWVKGYSGGQEGDERGWKEGTEKVELASGKYYYASEKAGTGYWEWRDQCWSPIFFYMQPTCCGPDYRGTPISSAGLTPIPRPA